MGLRVTVATVSRPAAQGRKRRRMVQCPDCGGWREVSYEHERRIRAGVHPESCGCLEVLVTEPLRVEWLVTFGAPAAEVEALTASGYVQTHGLPEGLRELARATDAIEAIFLRR